MIGVSICLILVGIILSVIIYPMIKNKNELIKNMQTKTVAQLIQKFEQMTILDKGDTYSEFVELKGNVKAAKIYKAPFSKTDVAYFQASATEITEKTEQIMDNTGHPQTKITKKEQNVYSESMGTKIEFVDASTSQPIVLEIGCGGCEIDIPTTLSKYVDFEKMDYLNLPFNIKLNSYGEKTLGFNLKEKVILDNASLYVVGEAYKLNGIIHISAARNSKKPFVITSKSKEEYLMKMGKSSKLMLIIGILLAVVGIVLIFV